MSLLFDAIPANPLIDRFIDLSYEVSERILRLLAKKGMSQRDLAIKLGKTDSEISKWLQGSHNLTLKTIASVEIALEENILQVEGISTNERHVSWTENASVLFQDMSNVVLKDQGHSWSPVYNKSYSEISVTDLV